MKASSKPSITRAQAKAAALLVKKQREECKCTDNPQHICDAHAKVLFGKCECKRCVDYLERSKDRFLGSFSDTETILDEASRITSGARPSKYGTPKQNHTRTAKFWSVYLGINLTSRQVCVMNMLQKISRDMHSPQRDNLVDIAGFAQNADAIERDCS